VEVLTQNINFEQGRNRGVIDGTRV